jgi:hypothetical protein
LSRGKEVAIRQAIQRIRGELDFIEGLLKAAEIGASKKYTLTVS